MIIQVLKFQYLTTFGADIFKIELIEWKNKYKIIP